MILYKMFSLIKKVLMLVLISAANLFVLTDSAKYVSLKNQECKLREVITSNKYMAFPCNIKVNRCNGSCNNVTNLCAKVCVPDINKNFTVKMFDLMTLRNATKQIEWHESCKCICRLDPTVCNIKQKWNKKNVDVNV